MDAERASFLDAADADGSEEDRGPAGLRSVLDELLARQVAEDDPPEVWATVRRLLDSGMGSSDVHRQLRLALSAQVLAAVGDDAEFDRQSYVAALGRLPLPSGPGVEAAIIEVVRERQPITADEVDRLVAERLGLAVDDPLTETLLDRVSDHLLDDGPAALLAGDLMVHVPSLVENVMLTHRLTEDERRTGVLAAADLPVVGISVWAASTPAKPLRARTSPITPTVSATVPLGRDTTSTTARTRVPTPPEDMCGDEGEPAHHRSDPGFPEMPWKPDRPVRRTWEPGPQSEDDRQPHEVDEQGGDGRPTIARKVVISGPGSPCRPSPAARWPRA